MVQGYERHDLTSCRGRVLVAGDIHGHFEYLQRALDACNFDDTSDCIIFLGDMINKGPDSHLAVNWVKHLRVIGNHEYDLKQKRLKELKKASGKASWLERLKKIEDRAKTAKILGAAPYMVEALLPSGFTAGFVHAAVPRLNWDHAREVFTTKRKREKDKAIQIATNGRHHSRQVVKGSCKPVKGIDHVFLGHRPIPYPITSGNTTLCDTSKSVSPVTIIDVDRWIEEHRKNNQ